MFASVTGPERRSLWAFLSFAFAVGIAASILMARVESKAIDRAVTSARDQALQLAQRLAARDLSQPAAGKEFQRVAAQVRSTVTSKEQVQQVRIWSPRGRVLFDVDRNAVGTKPTEPPDGIASIASRSGGTVVDARSIETFVPVSKKGAALTAVAQMSQPLQPVLAETGGVWDTVRTGLTIALAVALLMLGLTFLPVILRLARRKRDGAQEPAKPIVPGEAAPAPPRVFNRARRSEEPQDASVSSYMLPGFRQIEQARQVAEERAHSSEQSFQSLQAQFQRTIERVKTLEARTQTERALREQLRQAEAKAQAAEARATELEADLSKLTFAAGPING